MGMLMAQANTKAKRGTAKKKVEEKQAAQPPNGQPNVQMVTMEQAILTNLGQILRTVANIERQQLILGGKIDACFEKLNE